MAYEALRLEALKSSKPRRSVVKPKHLASNALLIEHRMDESFGEGLNSIFCNSRVFKVGHVYDLKPVRSISNFSELVNFLLLLILICDFPKFQPKLSIKL